ncbi:MAG: NUDIX hydrolase [Paludibacteraceae bacterium]|nr:NUDIX hydrolase [Paludibacteraceae bacterium]
MFAYRYPRASVTADAVLFAEREGQTFVLLILRGNEPYKGCWAFPGGFLNMDETVARCAERELEEETGIVLTGMQLVGIYSDVERDPRGRVITAAYTAMTTKPEANAADDAAAAKWWPINALPKLAFDHETILRDAMKVLEIKRY